MTADADMSDQALLLCLDSGLQRTAFAGESVQAGITCYVVHAPFFDVVRM